MYTDRALIGKKLAYEQNSYSEKFEEDYSIFFSLFFIHICSIHNCNGYDNAFLQIVRIWEVYAYQMYWACVLTHSQSFLDSFVSHYPNYTLLYFLNYRPYRNTPYDITE